MPSSNDKFPDPWENPAEANQSGGSKNESQSPDAPDASSADEFGIEELKNFKLENKEVEVLLIYDFDNRRDERIFQNQFDLDPIKTFNLEGVPLCDFDNTYTAYFGISSKCKGPLEYM